jgi:hypothetical protein
VVTPTSLQSKCVSHSRSARMCLSSALPYSRDSDRAFHPASTADVAALSATSHCLVSSTTPIVELTFIDRTVTCEIALGIGVGPDP